MKCRDRAPERGAEDEPSTVMLSTSPHLMQVLAACAAGQAGDTVLCRYKITPDPKGWESVVTEQEGEGELIPQLTQNVDFQSAPEFPLAAWPRGPTVPGDLSPVHSPWLGGDELSRV